MGTRIFDHREASDLPDSDSESHPDPTGHKLDTFTSHESDTEIRTTLHLRYPAERSIIHPPEKQLETSTELRKNTAISARIPGDRSVVRRVANWRLGSFRLKYLNHESMNTSRVASVVLL